MRFAVSKACCLLLLCGWVSAWGLTGHRIVAEIANENINPVTKTWLRKTLQVADLVWLANWADEQRNEDRASKRWHYAHWPDDKDSGLGLLAAIEDNKRVLADRHQSEAVRRDALKWLVHLVADAHQPLHVTPAAWRGGNSCYVGFLSARRVYSLHEIWDHVLIDRERLSFTEWSRWLADSMIKPPLQGHAHSWLSETYEAGMKVWPADRQTVCRAKGEKPFVIRWSYIVKQRPLLHQQLWYAGHRLAGVLDELASVQ